MKVFIYALSDPRTGRHHYVGATINPKSRLSAHAAPQAVNNFKKHRWSERLRKRNLKPVMRILDTVRCRKTATWMRIERRWIKRLLRGGCDLFNSKMGPKS